MFLALYLSDVCRCLAVEGGGRWHISPAHREALLAEHRQLQAELAAVRQGVGIMVVNEGRLYPLVPGLMPPSDSRSPPRSGLPPLTSRQHT